MGGDVTHLLGKTVRFLEGGEGGVASPSAPALPALLFQLLTQFRIRLLRLFRLAFIKHPNPTSLVRIQRRARHGFDQFTQHGNIVTMREEAPLPLLPRPLPRILFLQLLRLNMAGAYEDWW